MGMGSEPPAGVAPMPSESIAAARGVGGSAAAAREEAAATLGGYAVTSTSVRAGRGSRPAPVAAGSITRGSDTCTAVRSLLCH